MHTVHSGYSIVAEIKPGKTDSVRDFLRQLNQDPGNNPKIPFDKTSTVHFVTGVILPEQEYYDKILPSTLLFATSFSGPDKDHLNDLINTGGDGLRELFHYCEEYPENQNVSDDELKRFMKKHRHWDTFYSGMDHITPGNIKGEDDLRDYIQKFIDDPENKNLTDNHNCKEIKKAIQDHVSKENKFSWAMKPYKKSFTDHIFIRDSLIKSIAMLLLIIGSVVAIFFINATAGIIVLIVFLLLSIYTAFKIREYEKQDQYVAGRQPDEKVREIIKTQNHPVINEMTVCSPLKDGKLRPYMFMLALRIVNTVRGSINIPSVAAARWMAINKGRRMVFLSNFTNLSESYVRDFIDNNSSAEKINLLFGQGRGYPPTKWLMKSGALDNPNAFMNVVFEYQHVTDFWYCTHNHLSIDNVKNNRKIRQGLFMDMDEEKSRVWLSLL